jgi:hypothetical protein
MKTALGLLCCLGLGVSLLAATSGCEVACAKDEETKGTTCVAKSLNRFIGKEFTKSAEWQAGGDINIDGVLGKITLVEGAGTQVSVTFTPFSYRAHDGEESARSDIEDALKTEVVSVGADVSVKSWRDGGGSGTGAIMVVTIPAGFDGTLTIRNRGNGPIGNEGEFNITANAVGQARALDVSGSTLSKCVLYAAPSVKSSRVHCDKLVQLENVSDWVEISTTSGTVIGDAVKLRIASVAPGTPESTVTTQDGTISATFPAAGDYTIQAYSPKRGTVSVDPLGHCEIVEPQTDASKTLTCGAGGPTYKLTAGEDSLGDSDIYLEIQ